MRRKFVMQCNECINPHSTKSCKLHWMIAKLHADGNERVTITCRFAWDRVDENLPKVQNLSTNSTYFLHHRVVRGHWKACKVCPNLKLDLEGFFLFEVTSSDIQRLFNLTLADLNRSFYCPNSPQVSVLKVHWEVAAIYHMYLNSPRSDLGSQMVLLIL